MEGFAHSNEFCPNEACPDDGKLQKDQSKPNLKKIGFTRAGVQRYQCKTCNGTFTETRGSTPNFGNAGVVSRGQSHQQFDARQRVQRRYDFGMASRSGRACRAGGSGADA